MRRQTLQFPQSQHGGGACLARSVQSPLDMFLMFTVICPHWDVSSMRAGMSVLFANVSAEPRAVPT